MKISDFYISGQEAAKIIGVTMSQISHLCRAGQIEGAEKIGRNWVIPRSSAETFTRQKRGRKKFSVKEFTERALKESEMREDFG